MSDSRQQVLNAIRQTLPNALLPDAHPEHPKRSIATPPDGIDRFIAEAELLSARVIRAGDSLETAEQVVRILTENNWRRVFAWPWEEIGCKELPDRLADAGVAAHFQGNPVDLAALPVGITGAEAALADTGTIVVRGGEGRSMLASLLPPVHIALVDSRRLFPCLSAYLDSLPGSDHLAAASNTVFISGPSRTADIEQTLTLGVHGPRELIIILWG
nr:lactate utilization protein [Anaerolineae bacterium]